MSEVSKFLIEEYDNTNHKINEINYSIRGLDIDIDSIDNYLKKICPPLRSMRGGAKNRDLSRWTLLLQMYTGAKGAGASSCGKSMIVAHGS